MRRYRWVRNSILAASVLVLGMGSGFGPVYAQEETEAPEACVRILQRLDADKHVLEERCVDENNRLVIGPDGYAMVCYAYDENGKKTEEAYFDEAEHSLINPDGYALARFVYDENGKVVAHMLSTLRRRGSWLPPYLYTQGRVYGEGEYDDLNHKEELFGRMLKALTHKLDRSLCLFIEFSDISEKMFGYQHFRNNGFFPLLWQVRQA